MGCRSFGAASSNALTRASYTVPTTGTLLVWLNPSFAWNDNKAHTICRIETPGKLFEITKGGNNVLYCGWSQSGNPDYFQILTAAWSQNAWNSLIFVWVQGGRQLLMINGTAVGGSGALDAAWDTSAYAFHVGNLSALNSVWNGYLAHLTIWNTPLAYWDGANWNARELTGLTRGMNPFNACPHNIVDYWPLGMGSPDNSIAGGGRALTVSGTSISELGPPVSPYIPRRTYVLPAAAAPSVQASISENLPIIQDSITAEIVNHLTAHISDSLPVISDRLFPLPLQARNYQAAIADSLPTIQDVITGTLHRHLSAAISDTLPVISDVLQADTINLEKPQRWVAPLDIHPRVADLTPLYVAAHPVRHPGRYYKPCVKNYGLFTRSISAPIGFIRTGDVNVDLLDPDNSIRRQISGKTIRKAKAELRLGPEGGKLSSFLRPWIRHVANVSQSTDGELSINLRDNVFDFLEQELPGLINSTNFPNLPDGAPNFANHIVGVVSSSGGAVKCPLVDTVNHYYLVNRHKCKSVEVWRKKKTDDTFVLLDEMISIAEGQERPAEYTIKTDYYLDHGHGSGDDCTLIAFDEDQGDAEIRANVAGICDDDENLLYTNFADYFLGLFEYLAWLENRIDAINLKSFDDTRIACAHLACAGALTEPITYGEIISRLQRSSNIDVFADKNDRIAIHYTTEDDEPVLTLDDTVLFYKGSIQQQMADPTYNRIPYRYALNHAENKWIEDVYDNETDQEVLGEVTEEEPLQMYFVRDAETAENVVTDRASWLDLSCFRFEAEIPLIPVLESLELAQIVGITHFGGLKEAGYSAEQFKILELAMNVDNLSYRIKGIRRRTCPAPDVLEVDVDGGLATNARVGPYNNGISGELFAIFKDGSNRLKAIRSGDFGATWSESDAGNAPTLSEEISSFDSYSGAGDGLIHIATQESPSGRVAYHVFSMEDNVWSEINEEVLASCSNGGEHCVSIETRFPDGEPVIYFQGERVLISGQYWMRGYYSIKQSGAWSGPVIITPDPGQYPENLGQEDFTWSAHAVSSHCYIQRVVAGRENRMHFFYSVSPAVVWVQWSPDEYAQTLQGDFSLSGRNLIKITGTYYPAARNVGDPVAFAGRTLLAIPRKGSWGNSGLDIYAEGPSLALRSDIPMGWILYESPLAARYPAAFAREYDGKLYHAQATRSRYVGLLISEDDGGSWSDQVQAGPLVPNDDIQFLDGSLVTACSDRLYLAYFSGPGDSTGNLKYKWLRISKLPYSA